MPLPDGVRGLLVDIEGTTTPISFVYDVLFPHAKNRLNEYCARTAEEPELAAAIEFLRQEYEQEGRLPEASLPAFGDGAPYAHYLMAQDPPSPRRAPARLGGARSVLSGGR